jgi:hypothetical protein
VAARSRTFTRKNRKQHGRRRNTALLSPKGHNGGLTPQIADFINTIDPTRTSGGIQVVKSS